jgi:hypothetical protein
MEVGDFWSPSLLKIDSAIVHVDKAFVLALRHRTGIHEHCTLVAWALSPSCIGPDPAPQIRKIRTPLGPGLTLWILSARASSLKSAEHFLLLS